MKGTVKAEHFITFLDALPPTNRKYVLMDNIYFHKEKAVLAKLKEKGLVPLFTSPYSPDWNPIETFFSKLKHTFRKEQLKFPTGKTLLSLIDRVCETLPTDYCRKVFQHVFRNIKEARHR